MKEEATQKPVDKEKKIISIYEATESDWEDFWYNEDGRN